MSIIFKYDDSTKILLINAATLQEPTESIALDALRVIFIDINETSVRLEEKILASSTTMNCNNDSRYGEYASIIGEIWHLIDTIRRLELLVQFVNGIPNQLNQSLTEAFNKIRLVRNSFQHLDERIAKHFSKVGGSVYGDLIWRYRKEKDQREVLNCLISGVDRHEKKRDLGIGPENPAFKDRTGVYDLWLLYIRRDGIEVRISVDQAVQTITQLLEFLEHKYSRLYQTIDSEKQTFTLPYIFGLTVTQEAFDRINNKE